MIGPFHLEPVEPVLQEGFQVGPLRNDLGNRDVGMFIPPFRG